MGEIRASARRRRDASGGCPACNLINATSLPAVPFHTDTWPMGSGPVKPAVP